MEGSWNLLEGWIYKHWLQLSAYYTYSIQVLYVYKTIRFKIILSTTKTTSPPPSSSADEKSVLVAVVVMELCHGYALKINDRMHL